MELQNAADRVAAAVNDVGGLAAVTTVRVGFDPDDPAAQYVLPRTVGGEDYAIEFSPTLVFVHRGGVTVRAHLSHAIHIWNPGDMHRASAAQLALADAQFVSFRLPAGTAFDIVRRDMVPAGYQTFVYNPATEDLQALANAHAAEIDAFTAYAFDGVTEDWNETAPRAAPAGVDAMHLYPTMFLLERDGLRVVHFMEVRHIWDPAAEIPGAGHWRTTAAELNAVDNATPIPVTLGPGAAYSLERKELELTDRPLTNPPKDPPEYEHVLEYFLYA